MGGSLATAAIAVHMDTNLSNAGRRMRIWPGGGDKAGKGMRRGRRDRVQGDGARVNGQGQAEDSGQEEDRRG